ncbi:MAG: hypothetical protein M1365_11905, partial [Actinobacteria bacterium]|nr:hypothetical protein [Actinomycetota bacterium]
LCINSFLINIDLLFVFIIFILLGFTFATIAFSLINIEENINDKSNYSKEDSFELDEGEETCGFFTFLKEAVASFFYSIKLGAKLIFSHRALIWLIPAYTLPLGNCFILSLIFEAFVRFFDFFC